MEADDKPSLDEYSQKLQAEAPPGALYTSAKYYTSYLNGLTEEIKSGYFNQLMRALVESKSEYVQPEMLFLGGPADIELLHKPLNSVLDKIYRNNVLFNRSWPNDPKTKLSLSNFHLSLEDLFRSRIICRYMDGPKFACESLKSFCDRKGISSYFRNVTTNLGYHAWHFYYTQPVEDFGGNGPADLKVEVQFTTQLAEVISALTHIQYEKTRLGRRPDPGWEWDVKSDQFKPYYLGHGLHLLEGVILEYRNDVVETGAPSNQDVETKEPDQ